MKRVILCYAHRDEDWKEKVVRRLSELIDYNAEIVPWDDEKLAYYEDRFDEVLEEFYSASTFIFIITSDFLDSKFVRWKELAAILGIRIKEGTPAFSLFIKPCSWKSIKWLLLTDSLPKDGLPLVLGTERKIERELYYLLDTIKELLESGGKTQHRPRQDDIPYTPNRGVRTQSYGNYEERSKTGVYSTNFQRSSRDSRLPLRTNRMDRRPPLTGRGGQYPKPKIAKKRTNRRPSVPEHVKHINSSVNYDLLSETAKSIFIPHIPLSTEPDVIQRMKDLFSAIGDARRVRKGKKAYISMYGKFKKDYHITDEKWTTIWTWPKECSKSFLIYLEDRAANPEVPKGEPAPKKRFYIPPRPYLFKVECDFLAKLGLSTKSPELKEFMNICFAVTSHSDLTHIQHWELVCYLESLVAEKLEKVEENQ